jgi:hypothetical protein
MVAPATILRRVGRIHFDERSASFFRFAREVIKVLCIPRANAAIASTYRSGSRIRRLRPRRVTDAFRKTMSMHHPVHMKVFNTDGSEGVDDRSTVLVREIVTSPFDAFMHTSDDLAMTAPLFRSFLQSGMFALHLRQRLFFFAEEARVGNLFPSGQRCKGLEANINANGQRAVLQSLRLAHDRKGDVPFPCRAAMNRTGLDRPFDRAVIDHLDRANLGEAHPIVLGETEAALRIGETLVATRPFKAGVAGLLSALAASEEGVEGQIDAHRNILHDLGMHLFERGALFFEHRIRLLLLETREGNAIALVGGLTHVQQLIIEEATLFKMSIKRSLLFLRWIDPVSIVFQHRIMLYVNRVRVKKIPKCPIPSCHHKERPFIPMPARAGAFWPV